MNESVVLDDVALSSSFASLKLDTALLKNLSSLGYESMTPIQASTLPITLSGRDVIAQAKTGSGKTAAFGLALLHNLQPEHLAVQALVLCPTRELAEQVVVALRKLARAMPNVKVLNLSGGLPMKPQLVSLRHGPHVIVGTPGRVQKHLDKGTLDLNALQTLVLDEADRMLDMGFFDDIEQVILCCPKKRQTLMFSATFPAQVKEIASAFMRVPEKIILEESHTEVSIEQHFFEVSHPADKLRALKTLLLHYRPASALIFCNTKEQTKNVAIELAQQGFSTMALHGDMEQSERSQAITRFTNHSCSILVATDVAARGLDIKELPAVINFELAFEHDVHIHRIGRTARAGRLGLALSLVTPADKERIRVIEASLKKPLQWVDVHELPIGENAIVSPTMVTLVLRAGRKDKIRPGDILGALIKEAGLEASAVGKIDVETFYTYVAIHKNQVDQALQHFQNHTLKGRRIQVKKLVD